MHFFFYITITGFATILSLVHAIPLNNTLYGELTTRRRGSGTHCIYPVTYNVTSQTLIQDTPYQLTGVQVGPDPAGGSIASGYTYSKGVSYTGGVSGAFEFNEVFQFGASASVSITYTEGTSVSGSQNCPPNIICGLTASAELLQVEGTMTIHTCGGTENVYPCQDPPSPLCSTSVNGVQYNTPFPFISNYPVTVGSSQVNGQDEIVVTFRACYVGTAVAGLDACPSSN